jgi:hypothetical protein
MTEYASCVAALELLTAVHVPIAAAYSQLRPAIGRGRVPIVRHEGGRHRSRRKIAIIGKLSPRRFPPPRTVPCRRIRGGMVSFERTHYDNVRQFGRLNRIV